MISKLFIMLLQAGCITAFIVGLAYYITAISEESYVKDREDNKKPPTFPKDEDYSTPEDEGLQGDNNQEVLEPTPHLTEPCVVVLMYPIQLRIKPEPGIKIPYENIDFYLAGYDYQEDDIPW